MMLSRWASREWGGSSFGDKLFTPRIGMAQRLFLSWTRVALSEHYAETAVRAKYQWLLDYTDDIEARIGQLDLGRAA